MNGFSWIAVVMLVLSSALAGAQGADSANVTKIKAFLGALNSKDEAKIVAFVKSGFSPKVGGKSSPEERAARLMAIAKQSAPFELGKVLSDKPDETIVRINARMALELEMKVDFDPEDHGIAAVRIGGPGSQTAPTAKHYMDWKDLPDLLAKIKADTKVPAISGGFVKDGASQVFVAGEREIGKGESALVSDRWLIGSITKSMTAMMIARLIDRGLLRWETTIAEVLPKVPMRPEYQKVTVLQILQHRAGLPQDSTVDGDYIDRVVGQSRNRPEIRAKYAAHTLDSEPIAKPDERMAYSNAGYALAGYIAEVVANKPFEQLMQELVFDPLGMKSARIGVPGAPGNPGAKGEIMGHVQGADGPQAHVLDDARLSAMFAPAGAGVSMSIGDLLKFADYHLQGMRGHVTLMSAANFQTLHRPAGVEKYACGWANILGVLPEPYQGHNGSDGTFSAEIALFPQQNLAVVSIINAGWAREPGPPLQVVIACFERFGRQPWKDEDRVLRSPSHCRSRS